MDEGSRKELLDDVERLVKVDKSEFKIDLWGNRDLAYPIKRQTKGTYVHIEFEAMPQSVVSLDKSLKVEENVLRYLLVRN